MNKRNILLIYLVVWALFAQCQPGGDTTMRQLQTAAETLEKSGRFGAALPYRYRLLQLEKALSKALATARYYTTAFKAALPDTTVALRRFREGATALKKLPVDSQTAEGWLLLYNAVYTHFS